MGWVNVEDSYPVFKSGKQYLLYTYNDYLKVGFPSIGYFRKVNGIAENPNQFFSFDNYRLYVIYGVTHWMPLPELPKE